MRTEVQLTAVTDTWVGGSGFPAKKICGAIGSGRESGQVSMALRQEYTTSLMIRSIVPPLLVLRALYL